MNYNSIRRALAGSVGLFILVLGFQNCAKNNYGGGQAQAQNSAAANGNGDPYTGKPTKYYQNFDPANPCADRNIFGKALPNSEIHLRTFDSAFLVRDKCQDADPVLLDNSKVSVAADGSSLVYNAGTFALPPPGGDFDLIRANCPIGKTPIPGAVRTNLFSDSQIWGSNKWYIHPGLTISSFGSIFSLPSFLVQRTDPAQLDLYRRASELLPMLPNTRYSFTFLAKPGSVDSALWKYARNNESAQVQFNLRLGTTSVDWVNVLTGVSSTIRPAGNGFIGTVYFTTSALGGSSTADIGTTPYNGNPNIGALNDSFYGTAAQLERVDSYCQ